MYTLWIVEGFCRLPSHMVQAQCEQQDMESDYLAFEFTRLISVTHLLWLKYSEVILGELWSLLKRNHTGFSSYFWNALLSGHSISTQLQGCEKPKPPREVLCRCSGSVSAESSLWLSQSRCYKHDGVNISRLGLGPTYSLWTKSSLQATLVRPVS